MAYLALYRKYRPGNFDEVVGQDDVVRILKNQILSDRIGHAYLFTGIRGTGKTSIAKIFARAVNCQSNIEGNPCNHCEVCENIDQPSVMDIIEIDAASNRGVDEIRDIREKVIYPPKIGRYKVYIIDEVHMLTKEAFNALLKTLEEPPSHIIFILATTEVNKLPATILSRCQRFDIRPISQEKIAEQIRRILDDNQVAMEEEAIQLIAARGDHSMRDALSILDQAIDIRNGEEIITGEAVMQFLGMTSKSTLHDLTAAIFKSDAIGIVEKLKELKLKGTDSLLLTGQLIDYMRQVMIVKTVRRAADQVLEMGQSEVENLMTLAEMVGANRLFKIIDDLIEDRQKMRFQDCPDIILEMSLLRQCIKLEENHQQGVMINAIRSETRSKPNDDPTMRKLNSEPFVLASNQRACKTGSEKRNSESTAAKEQYANRYTAPEKIEGEVTTKNQTISRDQTKKEEIPADMMKVEAPESLPNQNALEVPEKKSGEDQIFSESVRASEEMSATGENNNHVQNVGADTNAGDQIEMLRKEIEKWNQQQDFFTAQIVSYGHLQYISKGNYEMFYQAPDYNMYAEMFRGRIQKQVEDLLSDVMGTQIHLSVECSSKKYEEMDIEEKTAAIIGEEYKSKLQVND